MCGCFSETRSFSSSTILFADNAQFLFCNELLSTKSSVIKPLTGTKSKGLRVSDRQSRQKIVGRASVVDDIWSTYPDTLATFISPILPLNTVCGRMYFHQNYSYLLIYLCPHPHLIFVGPIVTRSWFGTVFWNGVQIYTYFKSKIVKRYCESVGSVGKF